MAQWHLEITDTAYLTENLHRDGSVTLTICERIPGRQEGVPLAFITLSDEQVNRHIAALSHRPRGESPRA